MSYGIIYNGKHSYNDLELTILSSRTIKTPSKVKIKQTIPFMNGSYDFSNLYGSACYSERTLEYKFLIKSSSRMSLAFTRTRIENWLLGTNYQTKLVDDNLPGYYYMGECENVDFTDYIDKGIIKATFTAYPFKISDYFEGNLLWDNFNFELDIMQDTKFTVNNEINISIYSNNIINAVPTIITSSEFQIIKDNKTFTVKAGETKDYRFYFRNGKNNLTIKGTGTIEFRFRKEVL